MITEQMYKEAQEIVKLYELQLRKIEIIKSLPTLEDDMILEYKDLTGRWYEYTKDMQENIHFVPPLGTRVRKINRQPSENIPQKRSVAVISLDTIDFKLWKTESKLKEDGVSTRTKFMSGNTTYHCISTPCDLCSLAFDEIIETNRAKDNKDYNEIILTAKAALRN